MTRLPTPVRVEEALKNDGLDITVPAGASLSVGPFEAEYSRAFRLAEVTEYSDLYRLGFMRKELTEDQVTKAIHADDRIFREVIQRQATADERSPCACDDAKGRTRATRHRRHVQNHLIDLLQPLYQQSLATDDPLVLHAYGHAKAWINRPPRYLVGMLSVNDITIGDSAFLTMTPTVQYLHANEITIGADAHLIFASRDIHARCRILNGPSRFSSTTVVHERYVKGLSREVRS